MESAIWRDIGFHIRENVTKNDDMSVVDQIRNQYFRFLSKNHGEFSVELNLFEPIDLFLFETIQKVNHSVEFATKIYLKDFTILNEELNSLNVAQTYLDLIELIDKLYVFMSGKEFRNFVQDVSIERTQIEVNSVDVIEFLRC